MRLNDPRVVVREKFNLRHLQPEDVGEPIELCVADVSFISLTLILPPIFALLTGEAVVLIKPQFELSPEDVGKGGIVRDPEAHLRAVEKIRGFAEGPLSAKWAGVIESPILGAEGNKEFLAWLKK
jgi:23S rRNA (cytidine1920-2'-O)/16S rRNA (cytidine1409-2'-O)-methyltransferase